MKRELFIGGFTKEVSKGTIEGNLAIGGNMEVELGGMPSPVFMH